LEILWDLRIWSKESIQNGCLHIGRRLLRLMAYELLSGIILVAADGASGFFEDLAAGGSPAWIHLALNQDGNLGE
jgi:hypothetical protein